ncbi:Hpt domain-containing protein [Rhodoblastus acidophilus]|uniref:Hpt domain-containing protein n=1 Tax=Candidatus Rhodoblastus alkanivorans TaxID=2954117 RepID=A0ABS9Z6U4_9HYPH|nr:Hpt domain-containing protein [Candidatus Rhodoblastus alkanivorans]MCI4680233.1 Hpt domain-containing protein [Candidatus Rhodoblastus alkanivorans]MCI4683336.1 Hpt domain-containing protein [Candidatus Rhodoblastus alkanivorans]MDI4640649.1 Hpt domain-containing protein [Rhodoblastus acidophilus]
MGVAAHRESDNLNPSAAPGPFDSPIDLVHLARQTMGDRELEKEALALFDRQAEQISEKLRFAASGPAAADLAHKLKGSARAIGAVAVAAAADHYEHAARAGALKQADADHLVVATAAARAFLRELDA